MRDRLEHLQQVQTDSASFTSVELDDLQGGNPDHQLDSVLKETQEIRLEIQQIQSDITELKDVNYRTLNKTSCAGETKQDSNAIGLGIKRKGEAVLQRLHMMNDLRGQLEAQRGCSDPTARIARTQYNCLSSALQEVMFSYNDVEMSHREACKRQMQRQMEVMGREVSKEELEEMMEGEELTLFSVQLEGKTAHSALQQIKCRHQELLELEKRIQGIQELFFDVSLLVEEQGTGIENIEKNVQNVEATIQEGVVHLDKAKTSDKNNPFKKLFCGCFPCYHK
ncbi:syntaxin-11-like [Pholidichthys leucotaenia]